jgi:hypothetical protein
MNYVDISELRTKVIHDKSLTEITTGGFMPEKYYQRIAKEDNCVYIFDFNKRKWQKICDVDIRDVPRSVRESVKEDVEKEQAELNMLKSIEI